MKKIMFLGLLIVLTGCVGGNKDKVPEIIATASTCVINGKVTDVCNNPISGVKVEFSPNIPQIVNYTFTDDTGNFVFADLPGGNYTLTISKNNYNTISTIVNAPNGKITTANLQFSPNQVINNLDHLGKFSSIWKYWNVTNDKGISQAYYGLALGFGFFKDGDDAIDNLIYFVNVPVTCKTEIYTQTYDSSTATFTKDRIVYSDEKTFCNSDDFNIALKGILIPQQEIKVVPDSDRQEGAIKVTITTPQQGSFWREETGGKVVNLY